MTNEHNILVDTSESLVYQIRVQGHLGQQWAEWFDGLTITLDKNGDTLFTGLVVDQAALYGLLRKVRDLGLPLIAVHRMSAENTERKEGK